MTRWGSTWKARRLVGQPILAAAGFQPARAVCEDRLWLEKPPRKAAAGRIACPTIESLRRAKKQRVCHIQISYFRGSKRTSTSVLTLTGWPPRTVGL